MQHSKYLHKGVMNNLNLPWLVCGLEINHVVVFDTFEMGCIYPIINYCNVKQRSQPINPQFPQLYPYHEGTFNLLFERTCGN